VHITKKAVQMQNADAGVFRRTVLLTSSGYMLYPSSPGGLNAVPVKMGKGLKAQVGTMRRMTNMSFRCRESFMTPEDEAPSLAD
jgi:hypothetical protein